MNRYGKRRAKAKIKIKSLIFKIKIQLNKKLKTNPVFFADKPSVFRLN